MRLMGLWNENGSKRRVTQSEDRVVRVRKGSRLIGEEQVFDAW